MKSLKVNLLKIRSSCEAFLKQHLLFTGVLLFVNIAFFGVVLLYFLKVLVRSSRSADVKRIPNYLREVYKVAFVIIAGIKIICQPMLSFVLRSNFEGRTLTDLLKICQVWINITIGSTILQVVYATVIPELPFTDDIVFLILVFINCYLINFTHKKMLRQEEPIWEVEGVAPWA